LQDAGFAAADRAAIIMTNQSKWHISAYSILFAGGVLVPLDYKLTPAEHWQLLKHSGAKVSITEYPIWRQLYNAPERAVAEDGQAVLVTEAPPTPNSPARSAGKNFETPPNLCSSRANEKTSPASSTPPEPVAARRAV